MIVVVQEQNAGDHSRLLDEMFRLRKRVFCDRLHWDLDVEDGRERDRYDNEGPVYLINTDKAAEVVKGSLRLLPTTGPTLLYDAFSDTIPNAASLSAPTIWECTRFCVDDRLFVNTRRPEMLLTSGMLIAGLGSLAVKSGIETILGNFDRTMLRIYRAIGCEVELLGCTERYGQPVYLGSFAVSEGAVGKIEARLNTMRSKIAERTGGSLLAA